MSSSVCTFAISVGSSKAFFLNCKFSSSFWILLNFSRLAASFFFFFFFASASNIALIGVALTCAAETELADDPLEPTELGFKRRVCLDMAQEPALLIESSG